MLGIVGGSGTGKSVLLRTILGLNKPVAGTIEIFGKLRSDMTPEQEHAVERRWGVLFQDGALFSSLTVTQNIQVALKEHLHLPQHLMDEIAAVKIALVGLPAEAGPEVPLRAVGRHAQARGPGAGAGARSGDRVPGRADGRSRPDRRVGVRRVDQEPAGDARA